jgi:tRNA A37 threonylcarbamoyladenosine dehydratase
VGSHAAHLLLRSGVGRLRLVDFDQVSLSSLNRHCLATRRDVGTPKAACLASHFADILPEAHVEALNRMYDDASEGEVLAGRPDFVIDAIDNIGTKVSLLAACKRRGLPVLCVAGAGAKADPTRLRFVDVAESAADPLARAVRRRLRQEHGIEAGVTILMSTEKPRCGLVYGGEEGADMLDYQVVPNFRVRTIPVLGTTPAVFGLAAAAHVLCQLAGAPFEPAPVFRLQARSIQTQYDRLEARERERWGRGAGAGAGGGGGGGGGEEGWPGLAADVAEVEVALRELWRGTSARAAHPPSNDRALSRQLGGLALTRWDPARPAAVDNLVLFTREEADAHDAEVEAPGGLEALRIREPALRDRVEAVLARARREFAHSYFVDQ